MGFFRLIPLFIECFKLAGPAGLKACFRFFTGALILDEIDPKSTELVGVSDA